MIASLLAVVILAGSPSGIESRCKALMDAGELEMKKQTPEGFQAAIRIFDQLVLEDTKSETKYCTLAANRTAVAKRYLHDLVKPLHDAAMEAEQVDDWATAGRLLRRAQAINPYDAVLRADVDLATPRCLHEIQVLLEGARASQVAGKNLEAQRKIRSIEDYDDCTARKTRQVGDFPDGDTQ